MAATPSQDEIMAAIRDSGYLMEQEVASKLEAMGYFVQTNVPFEDADEGKSRELDVRATQRVAVNEVERLAAFIEILVECKNSQNPFVFIARRKNQADGRDDPREFTFPFRYEQQRRTGPNSINIRRVPSFTHLGFDKLPGDHQDEWKAVQFCRIDRKGSVWHANHGGLYDATFYPMAKALESRRSKLPLPERPDDWRYFWLFFPLIVTTADLYLINSERTRPELEAVENVTFVRNLKGSTLEGRFRLTFVRKNALENFVSTIVTPMAEHAAALVGDRVQFLKTTTLPWPDGD